MSAVHIFGRKSSFLMSVSTFPRHDRQIQGQIQEDRFSALKQLVSITNFIAFTRCRDHKQVSAYTGRQWHERRAVRQQQLTYLLISVSYPFPWFYGTITPRVKKTCFYMYIVKSGTFFDSQCMSTGIVLNTHYSLQILGAPETVLTICCVFNFQHPAPFIHRPYRRFRPSPSRHVKRQTVIKSARW